jgi:hypothetical protein
MMDGLKTVTLIKSAKFDFATTKVDGNTLFIGANGAGKTTLLRALLFFYIGDTKALGLNSKKERFREFYFPYENSYLVYTYTKENKTIVLTLYNSSSHLSYRFCMFAKAPEIHPLFVDESNYPVSPAKLWQKMRTLEGELSEVVHSGKRYKEILYAKNYALRHFSLFEAKAYHPFVRTLSNIFVNSKVDANTIKQVIVSALHLESQIDLIQIKKHLETFNRQYMDITTFSKHEPKINSALTNLRSYEDTLEQIIYFVQNFFASKGAYQEKEQRVTKELQSIELALDTLTSKIEKATKSHQKKRESYIEKIAEVSAKIKEAQKKKEHYFQQKIEAKIEAYATLPTLEREQSILQEQYDFMLKEEQGLTKEHENILNQIDNDKTRLINDKHEVKNQIEHVHNQRILEVKEEKNRELTLLTEAFHDTKHHYHQQNSTLVQAREWLLYEQKSAQKIAFSFSQVSHLQKSIEDLRNLAYQQERQRINMDQQESKLDNLQKLHIQKIETRQLQFQEKKSSLLSEIEEIKALLSPTQNSLIKSIYERSTDPERYLYLLDDALLRSDISAEFTSNVDQVYELDLSKITIPKAYTDDKLEYLKKALSDLEETFETDQKKYNSELKQQEKNIYKEKEKINEEIQKLDQNINRLRASVEALTFEKEREEKSFESEKERRLSQYKHQIAEKKEEIKALDKTFLVQQKEFENQKKSLKSRFTQQQNQLSLQYEEQRKIITDEIASIKERFNEKKEAQVVLYETRLKQKNIDTSALQNLQKALDKSQERIHELRSYEKSITLYQHDFSSIIAHLPTHEKRRKALKHERDLDEEAFVQATSKQQTEQKIISTELNRIKSELQNIEQELHDVSRFEQGSVYSEVMVLNSTIEIDNTIEPPSVLIQKIDQANKRYKSLENSLNTQLNTLSMLFNNTLNIKLELDPLASLKNLQRFVQENQIILFQELLLENLSQNIKNIIDNYHLLITSQGEIEQLIKKISKLFKDLEIGVVEHLSLRYVRSNDALLNLFKEIKEEQELNPFGYGASLFGAQNDASKMIEYLKKVVDMIEYDNLSIINMEESFNLEFRVIENGNDSQYVTALDKVGSNGTDVLVKGMIYIAMLNIFKKSITKKELYFHLALDEIGILSQSYLQELILFANAHNIYFLNGAPDEKLIETYKRVNLVSQKHGIAQLQALIIK